MAKRNRPSALARYQADMKKDKRKPIRSLYVSFRVTQDERLSILTEARRVGHSLSDYCRLLCLRNKVMDMSETARKERRILINMANNCNQIARRINTEGVNPWTVAAVEQLLDDIQKQKRL